MQNRPTATPGVIDSIAASLRPNGQDDLQDLFQKLGCKPPRVIWSPKPDDLNNPLITRFADICQTMAEPGGQILARNFELEAMAPLRDWLLLLDIEGDGTVYRYRHYGEGIADIGGLSMLGKTTENFDSHASQFFTGVYRAVQLQKERALTIHQPRKKTFARCWERLIVPLFGETGEVAQFAVLTVPDNELRPGLEIIPDPVLIADENRIVRFANRAARELFGRQIYLGSNMDLFSFAGIETDLPAPPAELARTGAIHDVVSIVLRGTMIERFHLTVSGTEYMRGAYYVITLRPALDQHSPAGAR